MDAGLTSGGHGAESAGAPAPDWHVVLTGPRAGDQRREALDFLAVSLGHRPGTFTVNHHCPRCGAQDHGAPGLAYSALARRRRGPDALAGVDEAGTLPAVSFSRAAGWLATAWVDPVSSGRGWCIGVDLEVTGAPAFASAEGLGAVAYSPDESAAVARCAPVEQPMVRAALWSLKEAVVKARGTGFEGDPSEVLVTAPGTLVPQIRGNPEAVVVACDQWPGGPVGEGLTGMLCLLRCEDPGSPSSGWAVTAR
ncbi:4'-phosphopantetheinyl transferase superfamily protein [Citricoccus nitrophenolicus]|uniref:4'-phosphopantetheinyl transferase superfamily protein n=1 Tax=Citricoccus nitrophenolicus TaxID=863575 RepID=UPI0039B5206E